MSVEFSNTYQEILLDNLVSIIKQNFIFQTQLKLAETTGKDKAELQNSYDILNGEYSSLREQLSQMEGLKMRVESNDSAHEEKSRIQTALNDELKRSADLKRTLEERDGEISNLKEQILKLESLVPPPKTKKVNPVIVPDIVEPTPLILSKTKVSDGSTF
jgi:predicted RNase H-like nuclease (RuvC/YqgF family)